MESTMFQNCQGQGTCTSFQGQSKLPGKVAGIDPGDYEIRQRVDQGMPYMGASAGSNVAGLTICTTNDMPIVYPSSFDALGLVRFNINPHYIDPEAGSKHMGETRETRINEFHVFNDVPVIGIREGAMLHREGDSLRLEGSRGGCLFRLGVEVEELAPAGDVDGVPA